MQDADFFNFFFWCQTLKVLTHQQAVILSPVLNFAEVEKGENSRPLFQISGLSAIPSLSPLLTWRQLTEQLLQIVPLTHSLKSFLWVRVVVLLNSTISSVKKSDIAGTPKTSYSFLNAHFSVVCLRRFARCLVRKDRLSIKAPFQKSCPKENPKSRGPHAGGEVSLRLAFNTG